MATLQNVVAGLTDLKVSVDQLAVVLASLKADAANAPRQEEVDAAAQLVEQIQTTVAGALA